MSTSDTAVAETVTRHHPHLVALSRDLYDHPEIAWEEIGRAHV